VWRHFGRRPAASAVNAPDRDPEMPTISTMPLANIHIAQAISATPAMTIAMLPLTGT
jgi:hypothetical protein